MNPNPLLLSEIERERLPSFSRGATSPQRGAERRCRAAAAMAEEGAALVGMYFFRVQYHPDVNKQDGAEEKFKEIANAYELGPTTVCEKMIQGTQASAEDGA